MATTREQAEAYEYAKRRMTTSLLRGTDEARRDPRRRLNRSLGSGIAVGVLVAAVFGIIGWLGGGNGPDLPTRGVVVVGDGGDPYIVEDGVVHRALNLASAMLVGGSQITEVRQGTLDEAPRGRPVGIPGAPDALPDADDLLDEDWTLCATPSETGGPPVQTTLYVAVPSAAEAGPAGTVLVEAEDGALWLLTEGRRYALTQSVAELLGLREEPVPLPLEVIVTVPEGPSITVPDAVAGAGEEPAADLPFEAEVGDVAHTVSGPNQQYFVVRSDGLVAVSELVYTLLATPAGADRAISSLDAAQAPRSPARPPGDQGWPDATPVVDELERDQPVCVSTPPGGRPGDAPWRATVHLPQSMPEPADMTPVTAASAEPLGLLNSLYVPAGSGAVVRSTTSGGSGGSHVLVTDDGTAYRFASAEAVERLGYQPAEAPSMPSAFVDLLPTGPVLDPDAAAQEEQPLGEEDQ
ncbi:type VII secretion protein EccB [Streptomyces sp. B6B3]|uniref:type VII secretion protein EccB n=1 Tax=Streptomyces sp. B6B3 TaxID=3153570 RepID=UPI00325C6913